MKKTTFACLCSFVFLWLSSLTTVLLRGIYADEPKENAVWFVAAGLGAMLLVGLVYLIFRNKAFVRKNVLNAVCFVLNALLLGVAMTGWYVDRGFNNPLWMMTLICLCSVAYLWVMYAVMQLPFIKNRQKASKAAVIVLLLLSLVGYILLLLFTRTTYVSTYGYYMIIEIAFFFAMCLPSDDEAELFSHMIGATYSVIAVAAIMLLIILTEGDIDLGLDLDLSVGEKKKKESDT